MDVEQIIREYLPDVIHMSLATSVENKPWVCELHYIYDDQLNLYFMSKPSRRHSREIALNPNVAGNIVSQHTSGQKPRGVYFEGAAQQLKNIDKNSQAYKLYDQRFGISQMILEEVENDDNGHKFYKIKPTRYVIFDTVNFPKDSRQEWRP